MDNLVGALFYNALAGINALALINAFALIKRFPLATDIGEWASRA